MKKPEEKLQEHICAYIELQYPKALYNTDLSGMKMTKVQAKKVKKLRKCNGFPDMNILWTNEKYHGLFLELKAPGKSPFKKNGKLKKDEHLEEQSHVLSLLNLQGYKAVFVWDLEDAKRIIDDYMSIKQLKQRFVSTNRVSTFYPSK